MTDAWLFRAAGALIRRTSTYGRDVGVALPVGILPALVVRYLDPEVTVAERGLVFLFGFFAALAVQHLFVGGERQFYARIGRLKEAKEGGALTEAMYERFVEQTANWYAVRWFGAPLPPPAAEPPKPTRTRKPPSPPPPDPPAT